ncbi:type I polyketide synthase loading module domain protein [Mycobacterium ulcerans str. Harvey]|uniref:Type I polyketide synthase loading module domain protein n=1 Tax=Mycobacterium ulcerans str. Harvey TaxID=1299332 RepID=A0ABN0QKZ3_MYCUL|nr:type I polyketide synthase loading module domain protein [Mycobacterium ulcerans str. Harvey]
MASTGTAAIEVDDFYDDLAAQGYNYGPTFQGVQRICVTTPHPMSSTPKLNYPKTPTSTATASTPALFDAALHPYSP